MSFFARAARLGAVALASCGLCWQALESLSAAEPPDFDKAVAPLLARRCLDCHNGGELKGGLNLSTKKAALAGGESGLVLSPGKPDDSLLWQYVDAGEMPPKKPLPAAERKLLKEWIASGANWGTDPIDPFRFTTDSRAGYDWWALQPLNRPAVPALPETPGGANGEHPLDAFILERLGEKRLALSPPAERRALLRRLSFDLLGLPPTPEETAEFLSDKAPDAYERLVDRLLASPRYGERWARHWLDVARFGESQGFERDKLRETSWRYRDWCIAALNADLPYDEFARLQIAGDALRPGDPAAIVATGFLVAGPYDEVGQSQQSLAMRAVVRQDELEDIVGTLGQTFLGLTVNCARCHDHKFDPVRQSEYYRLAAAVAGVKHGERDLGPRAARAAEAQIAGIEGRLAAIEARVAAIETPARQRVLAARGARALSVSPPKPLASWEFDDRAGDGGPLPARLEGNAKQNGGRLELDGKSAFAATAPLSADLAEKTLEAWVSLANLSQRGGGIVSVQTLDGAVFDALVFGEREPGKWLAGSNFFARTQDLGGPAEQEADKSLVHLALVYQADGTISAYRNGESYGKPYKSAGLVAFKAGEAQVVFGLRHGPPGGNKLLAGAIERARLYDRALAPDEVAASAGVESKHVAAEQLQAELAVAEREELARLILESKHLRTLLARAQNAKAYAVVSTAPGPTHLLRRGNPAQPAELLAPGGVASLVGLSAEFELAANAPDGERRKALAAWLTDGRNPLFARVIVNRLWQYHFGVGLVDTPNDFGFSGGRPSHPELLDWLASELVSPLAASGPVNAAKPAADARVSPPGAFSLKHLHRLIVTSAAYRQAALPNSAAMMVDAENRLLWRKAPLRLEAEAVRDAMLAVAGELNLALGGPGYEDFSTFTSNSQFYEPLDPVGPSFQRRSVYRTWVRSGRNRFLDVFDCPDPSTKTPRRAVTTTPLQALSLLNNSFVLRMSDRLAERAAREAGTSPAAQIRRVYELAYCRQPTPGESALAETFVARHGLASLCRVVFNTSEFMYVD